jgi:GAF domain-containing protein
MGTPGTHTRNGKKPAARGVARSERPHPAVAKLAVALKQYKEAVEQQAATAEVLRAMSKSPGDAQPVFEAIVENAHRLCQATYSVLYRYDGKLVHLAAAKEVDAKAMHAVRARYPQPPDPKKIVGRAIREKKVFHTADIGKDGRFPASSRIILRRAVISVPLVRNGAVLGVISCGRAEARAFTKKEIWLLKTFADQAVIAIENARLFNETREALEHQKASAEILRIVAGSVESTDPVFKAITQAGMHLVPGSRVALFLVRDGQLHYGSHSGIREELRQELAKRWPAPLDRETAAGACIVDRRVIHISDMFTEGGEHPRSVGIARASGYHGLLCVPLVRGAKAIGCISIGRVEPGPFTEKQIALVRTFADQAAIAIRNAGMFREIQERNAELKRSLDSQAASSEILASISSSMTDAKPVFDAIVRNLLRLFGTQYATVTLVRDGQHHLVAFKGEPGYEWLTTIYPRPLSDSSFAGRAILSGQVQQIAPIIGNPAAPLHTLEGARKVGFNSIIAAPMIREGTVIGSITTARRDPVPFDERQVALIKAFADQAVIAIENARLFNETKEALEQQTAISEVLRAISSSPADVKPVLDAVAIRAARICEASDARIFLTVGDHFRHTAGFGDVGVANELIPLNRDTPSGRAIIDQVPQHIHDMASLPPGEFALGREIAGRIGWRTILSVPLLRDDRALGTIVLRRKEVRPFSEKQIALLRTFADQAAIAIENARLFNETKEALEQQTATNEVLGVISRSPTDLRPVFDAILASATRLCDAHLGVLNLFEGENCRTVAQRGGSPEFAKWVLERGAFKPGAAMARILADRRPFHVPDAREGPGFNARNANAMKFVELGRVRTYLAVPLLKDEAVIGSINIFRPEVRPFTDKQIPLVSTFANQAVIAIENVRLFKELQARTEALTKSVSQLTALGEVGQAISSTLDLETVLKTIVSRAVQLTGLDAGAIYEYDEPAEQFHLRAAENFSEEVLEVLRSTPIRRGDGAVGGTAVAREPIQVHETQDEGYKSRFRDLIIRTGRRALLAVPLMHEEHIVGALAVHRNTPGPFPPEVVDLLKTFATQSVLAIQNARLFREIAEKGRQLEVASQHKSQFLASMSHELRTPLNALLGFNEMILGEVYGEVPGEMKPPLAQMQASGKHLLRLINNVLDLAKIEAGRMELALSDYSVHDTVESVRSVLRPLAADKGLEFFAAVPEDIPLAYGDPGRITQCLMNLAGNSLKFTKAGRVEIFVRLEDARLRYSVTDTGIGIPADKIESLFTEFKQTDATIASEYGGTGLGLSITKKFVEMHGGRIWVESEPGRGSTFSFEIPLRAQEAKAA